MNIREAVVMTGVVVNLASYYAAYVVSLAAALAIAVTQGHASGVVIAISAGFALFATAMVVTILGWSGREENPISRRFEQANPRLVRNPSVLLQRMAIGAPRPGRDDHLGPYSRSRRQRFAQRRVCEFHAPNKPRALKE